MEFLEVQQEDIYREVQARALAEGAYTSDAWRTIVDDVVDGHEEFGEVDEDGVRNLKDILMDRFEDFRKGIPSA